MQGSSWVSLRLATAILLALGIGCVKRPIDYQREQARTLRPAELDAFARDAAAPAHQPRVLRVRAWVDEDFQGQTPRWRDRIEEQVRRADKLLEPQFGHRLELVEIVAWQRPNRRPDLESALVELEATDPGRNVDLVIGYVSAVRMPTALTESLGMARLGGRHLVLRSMVWVREFDDLEHVLDLLTPDERNALARERRVHREVTILLHEWAHTMGVTHESSSASIMAGTYHPQAAGFSPEAVRVIEAGLRASPRLSLAAESPPPGSDASRPPQVTPSAPAAAGPLPPNLRPLPFPGPRPGPRPGGPASNEPGSARSLAMLATREAALQAGGGAPAAWLQLARDADRLGAPALAERAATRAGPAPGAAFLASDARRQRRGVALPLDGSIAVAREPDYVRAVNGVLEPAADRQLPKAREALRALGGAFPGSPGLVLGACALAAEEGGARGAAACVSALNAFDEAPLPHVLLGIAHGRASRWAEAREQFQQALALDDSTGEVWSRLARVLGELGDAAALRELEVRYQARFGFALRPSRD